MRVPFLVYLQISQLQKHDIYSLQLTILKSKNKLVNKRLVSQPCLLTNCFLICLSTSQGHGPWPVSRPWLPCVLYMERVDGGVGGGCGAVEGVTTQSWYVCLSKASRRLASPAQTAADPCGDTPASSCCRVPLKTPRSCLSDWPYGRQCHPGTPCCARHGLWEAWVGSMAISPNSHIPIILSLVSPQYVRTQLHAVIYSRARRTSPSYYTHIDTHSMLSHTSNTSAHVNILPSVPSAAHLLISWLSNVQNIIRSARWTWYSMIIYTWS